MKYFEFVVFDFDDTLILSRSDRFELLFKALRRFGSEVSKEDLAIAWGKPFDHLVASAAPDASEKYDEFLEFYCHFLSDYPPVTQPELSDVLSKAASHSRLFVLSSSHSRLINLDLERLSILHHFDKVFGYDSVAHPKPDPRCLETVFLDACDERTNRNDWLLVGDSVLDYQVARINGVTFRATTFFRDQSRELLDAQVGPKDLYPKISEEVFRRP